VDPKKKEPEELTLTAKLAKEKEDAENQETRELNGGNNG
jgi:hypothetical protein